MVTRSGESGYSIKELPSEKFYERLDSYLTFVSNYYSDSSTLSYPYKNNEEIRSLFAKVVKYIKTQPSILNGEHLKVHQCNLFNYWIYEQIDSYCKHKTYQPFQIFADFLLALSGFTYYSKDNTCKLDNSMVIIPDRKERKELYEYCIDHKTILDKSKLSNDNCKKYYTYVEKKIKLYEKFQALCSSRDVRKCPEFFYKICENKDPKLLLDQLSCKDEMVKEKQQLENAHNNDLASKRSNSFPGTQSVSDIGNVFLGVVVTSMTSGFLYKVNINLIKINQ
ncbi:hypothetical protein PVIIG_06124 [Plasmodium vivax India VII]|uniref:Uncharacterized protein n=1 Tax=Plasmodium vivax India VII TaxID=1077284 RepID=A0A0J9SII6_PLAVI|nr:hypothetical protein PVIIG_06124 [Plasmodium vivax India VII]